MIEDPSAVRRIVSATSLLLVAALASPALAAQPAADAFLPPRDEVAQLPVGCGGYCPVTLKLEKRWIAGRGDAWGDFDGRRYLMADRRKQAIFLAAPRAYAPLLGGDCPVTYGEFGRRKPGELQFGALHQERLTFFLSAAHLRKFKESPEVFFKLAVSTELQPGQAADVQGDATADVGAVDNDLAMSGYCPVTLCNEGRWVRGRKEFTSLLGGLEFRFAGADQQTEFLVRPERFFSSAGGYCPVTLSRSGRRVKGSAQFVVEYDSRLYLFASDADKQEFIRKPQSYADVAIGGALSRAADALPRQAPAGSNAGMPQ